MALVIFIACVVGAVVCAVWMYVDERKGRRETEEKLGRMLDPAFTKAVGNLAQRMGYSIAEHYQYGGTFKAPVSMAQRIDPISLVEQGNADLERVERRIVERAAITWKQLEVVCSFQHILRGKTVSGFGRRILRCGHGALGEDYHCCRLMCPVWDDLTGRHGPGVNTVGLEKEDER